MIYFYGILGLHVVLCFYFCVFNFVFVSFCCQMYSWNLWTFLFSLFLFLLVLSVFWFFRFSSSIPTEKSQEIFLVSQKKNLGKKTFVHPLGVLAKSYCRNKMGNHKRAVLLHLTHSGSQSEHRIHCTSCPLTTLKVFTYFLQGMRSGNHVLLLHLINKHSIEISHNRPLLCITKVLEILLKESEGKMMK